MCRLFRSFEDKILDFVGCKSRALIRIMIAITFFAIILEASVNFDSSCAFIVFMNTLMECIFDGQMSYPIQLSSDYLNEVFSAICTIAVLGNAILSMLFGVYEKKTLGIPFQDVLNHSLIGDEQKFTIKALTISILFAIIFYVFKWANLLFSILIQDVFLLLFSCISLWRFLSDRNTQKAAITEIVKNVDASQYAVYVDSWFKELDGALVPNNIDEAQQYIDLINLVMECCPNRKKQIQACVGRHVQAYFNSACDKLGFVEAFDLLRRILELAPDHTLGEYHIAFKYLEGLKIKDQVDIVNSEVTDLIQEIFRDQQFSDEDKASYAYLYFCAVVDNVQLNSKVKNKQIYRMLGYLCDMREADYGILKARVIINIVRDRILFGDNCESEKDLFRALIESLRKNGHRSCDKYYLATICEIYRAFFIVTHFEGGSLTDDYRSKLVSLFKTATNERDTASLSFMTLILDRAEDVVSWFAHNAAGSVDRPNVFWEYHGLAREWKKVVWTKETITKFAYSVYHILGSVCGEHPYMRILESDEYNEDEKRKICRILLEQFNCDGFNPEMMHLVNKVAEFSGVRTPPIDPFWNQEYSYYQDKLIELESGANQSNYEMSKMCNEDIWKEVQKSFDGKTMFVYDQSCSLFPGSRITFATQYVALNQFFGQQTVDRVSHKVSSYLSKYLSEFLPQISIDCSLEGIKELLQVLTMEDYECRTFRYMGNHTIALRFRNSPEFTQLAKRLDSIPYSSDSRVHENILLKKKLIPFNFHLQYDSRSMTPEECISYVHDRIRDGICRINGNHFDYDHALEYATKNVVAEEITIFVHVGLDDDDGFELIWNKT